MNKLVKHIIWTFGLLCSICLYGQEMDYAKLHKLLLRDALQYEKENGLYNPVLAEAYYKIAMLSFKLRNYRKAKNEFEKELSIREQLRDTGSHKVKLIKAQYNVTVLHQQLGEYQKAEKRAQAYLSAVRNHYGEAHAETVDAYQLLASIAYQLHRLLPYEQYSDKAFSIARQLPNPDTAKLINLLILKAGGYIETGDFESGDNCLMQAL